MAYDASISGPYSGRPAFDQYLYVRRDQTQARRSSYAYEVRARNPERRTQTYALSNFPLAVNVGGQIFEHEHNLDFRGGQEYITLATGSTGWFDHNSAGELTIVIDTWHGPAGVFGSADPAPLYFVTDTIKPETPTGLSATRVSDSQQTLNVTVPWGAVKMVWQRSTDDGAWQTLATVTASGTYTDKSTQANRKYTYRVAASNGGGQGPWSSTATIYTSPAAPTGVSAARTAADDIRVDASGRPAWATSFNIRDGGALVASGVSLPWTHVDPNPADTHTYTVQGVVSGIAGAWSSPSNTVQLISPPSPPQSLSPNGAVAPSDESVTLSWVHSPVDSSPQSAYELQYRAPGGAWTVLTGTTAQARAVTLPVGAVEWQVRTKGAHPDWSPWSATASFTVIDRPGVAVVQPADTWDASTLTAVWTWFQAQGRPQSAWRVELLDATGTVVESRTGSGATATLQLATRLTEGAWTVRAQAATGEVWSAWGVEAFTVAFTPPVEPVLTGVWDESQGGVQITVSGEQFGVAVLDEGAWYAEVGV
ncbi:fibronectin type III domain-containing protein [Microbacterium esteraromaticum]|uniref:Fibronectin type III domain-containing protein n=1 Tax=Microbacterium esteraromaticum TaxID=57043 RepID=A0A7D8AKN0_9MICO|nr:fibronectin type III domain-containing protein [Microbacterium esteraromaticum]QMU97849.1 fibronectin type III domain-containing protein [Microbacterium esteraromaticum]